MRWSYKTVHYELKKEGLLGNAFLDESEVEQSLNEYGKAGWELVSMLETMDGLIAVFKQPLSIGAGTFKAPAPPAYSIQPDDGQTQSEKKSRDTGENTDVFIEGVGSDVVLLDEFEVVEEKKEKRDPGKSASADVGSIRIE